MKKTTLLKTMLLLCARIVGSSSAWADDTYVKVTNASDLVVDGEYILVEASTSTKYLANTTYSSNKYGSATSGFTISSDGSTVTVASGTAALVLKLGGTENAWTLYDINYKGWVGKNTSSNTNFIRSASSSDLSNSEYKWTIKLKGDDYAIYSNYSSYTGRYWGRNSSSIGPYDGNSYPACVLYKKLTGPSVSASNVSYAADITSGEIPFTITNPVEGKSLVANTSDTWISNVAVDSENSKVTFGMTENESTEERQGTITLNYGSGLASKDVTVTQAAAVAKFTVTINTPENGTLVVKRDGNAISSGDQIPTGTELTIETTPARGYSFTKWQYKTDGDWNDGEGTSYTVTSAVSFQAIFTEITKYTVTLSDDPENPLTEEYGGEGITLPSRSNQTANTFEGWSLTEITTATTTPVDIIPAGLYNPEGNVTLYPVYSYTAIGTVTAYKQLTNLSEVTEGIYVWGSQKTTSTGQPLVYMPNTEASGSAPELIEGLETEVIDDVTYLSNDIETKMLWDFTSTGTANQFYIRPHGSTTIGFGCTNSTGNNIRISSNYKNTKWTVAASDNYNWQFKNDATTPMYIAVYDKTKWRNYTSASTNQNGKFYLYKAVEIENIATYYTSHPVNTIDVTITSATWASFSCGRALDFTGTGVTAYIAKEKDASTVTLTEITKVPANTGIVVNGTAATHSIPVLSGDADATTDNLLMPWLTAGEPTETTYYTLAVDNDKNPVFKQSTGGTLAAGKAYLVMPAGARELTVSFDEEGNTTAIEELKDSKIEELKSCFNLNGQRVAQPTKGLYIVNGRKVVVK